MLLILALFNAFEAIIICNFCMEDKLCLFVPFLWSLYLFEQCMVGCIFLFYFLF